MGTGSKCGGCSLERSGAGFTEVEIGARYESTRLLLIGEASGEAEARDSLPFRPYAQSGSLLSDALRETNIGRADIAITNILRCRPPKDWLEGAPYQYSATQQCLTNYLAEVIGELRPRVILALGGTAMRALTVPIKGRSGTLDYIRGYALAGGGVAEGVPVIASYHPAFLRRGASHLTPLLQRDLRRAFLIATGKLQAGEHYILNPLEHGGRYQTMPSVAEAWEWFRNIDPNRSIYCDIETPRSRREDEDDRNSFADRDINLIQFTQRRSEGIALPWRDDFVDIARSVLASGNRKVGHNWFGFDLPVLAANDVVVNGEQDDTMLQFHHYHPDLPQNLQAVAQFCGFPFAWKHLADSEQELYGCIDVDATCWADETLSTLLRRDGLAESYERYVRQFWPILRDMSERGLPISDERRLALKAVIVEEDARATASIKLIVPEEVLAQKQKEGYKNPPILKCEGCGERFRVDHFCAPLPEDSDDADMLNVFVPYADLAEENGLVLREVVVKENAKCRCTKKLREQCPDCAGSGVIPAGVVELRWAALTEFNPNSSHQVKRYMRYRKHPIPKHAKRTDADGEASDTTEVKELERLYVKTKDEIYPLLIEKRQLTKIEGTYVEGWKPAKDGRVRTTFTFKPATLQLSSREPNVQNGLKHADPDKQPFKYRLAKAFNGMQMAEAGHLMVNFDFKSFHAQTLACEAGDADYLRLAKIDVHSFVTCHFLRHAERNNLLSLSDDDLRGVFKELKRDKAFKFVRDFKAKRCIAEGELVLTDHGLKPIQTVTITDRVWDGVEWVHHEGLIDQGIREVITYDGLTATPDHEVFTDAGQWTSIGQAASCLARLHRTGLERFPIRTRYRDKLEADARERLCESEDEVLGLRKPDRKRLFLSEIGTFRKELPPLCGSGSNQESSSGSAGSEVRRDHFAVFESSESGLSSLRRERDRMSFQLPQWVRAICGESVASRFVPWPRDRQDQQQRPLRDGKSEAINSSAKHAESPKYSMGADFAREGATDGMGFTLRHSMDGQIIAEGVDWGTDHNAREDSCTQGEGQDVEETTPVARRARTYDLLNAGPRHQFTVSNVLVHNCILGLGFGMGAKKLYQMNLEDFANESEAKALMSLVMEDLFPKLKRYQNEIRSVAAEQKYLQNKFGAIRRFYDVQRWDRKQQKFVGGDQAEAAVAFLPASSAFGHIRDVCHRIRDKGWDERYQLVNTIHDSLVFHVPVGYVEECVLNITAEMSKPSTILVYPKCAPLGLSVEAEASVGESLADMVEYNS